MAAAKRLLLLRRITPPHPFHHHHHHALFSKRLPFPPSFPPHTTTSPFSRQFSSSSQKDVHFHDLNNTDTLVNISIVGSGVYDDSILPVRVLITMLDSLHNFTGLPWWMLIASSTLMMRLTLFPVIVLQLQKLKRIGELFPKLPPPFPPPMSGKSITRQFKLFMKEKRTVGCPSFFWFTAAFFTQVPCFFLWMTTIRRMSLEHHPGFDCGGTLWFQNLIEYPNGALGPVVPLMIAFLHYANVQISFNNTSLDQLPGVLAKLAKYYKYYLEILTLPILFFTFNVPQGSLVYWLTNSSLSLVQQLTLKHPTVRMKLGLPDKNASHAATSNRELGVSRGTEKSSLAEKEKLVSIQDLSPIELVNGSLIYLSKGNKDKALPLLRLAIQKDPENGRASLVMGQILLNDGLPAKALEYFERIVSRLSVSGNPTEIEDVHLLIMSSQLSGVAYAKQNNYEKAITHLQRVASLEEPEDPKTKVLFYDGLILLCSLVSMFFMFPNELEIQIVFSSLYNVGRKAEATQYAYRVVAYDSNYKYLLEQIEKDEDEFVNDLVKSRRGDY
ncbi:transporter [Lithospermum erythrorhizon]|uniref:Transporter n=1 Tax=Lithospermum erythrorhizon TaxID=34254 RepID=A0AAV3P4K9_LITER